MLAIVACSHAWTWPPTDKTHPQLNWRLPVPVTPEQEGFVHPVLPPEPPADDPPIDCRVPTDRARDFKPNFLRALIQLFTGIVAWSLSDSLKGTSAAAAAQAMRGAGRRAIQMLAGSGAAVAAPAARLLDASLRRLDGRAPAPAAVAAPPPQPQPANATAATAAARSPPSLSLAASAATATPMFGPRKAMAVELWFFAVFEIAAAVANYGAVYVHAARFGRAIRRNSAQFGAQFSTRAILRRPRRAIAPGTRGSRAAAACRPTAARRCRAPPAPSSPNCGVRRGRRRRR